MLKSFRSKEYKMIFDSSNGNLFRWGKSFKDNPKVAPFPEILDIEISNICSKGCVMCYKDNKFLGKNMSFREFKLIFDKLPKELTQIAFGIGDLDANPDLYNILEYTRDNKVIPNITINGEHLTDFHSKNLVRLCGAVAVSYYDVDTCADAVLKLTNAGLKQCNIHALVSQETEKSIYELISVIKLDPRFSNLNALVFLSLKRKGRGVSYHNLSRYRYKDIIQKCFEENITIGFDSCSANTVASIFPQYLDFIEPCESTCFSMYINTKGEALPCSFLDNTRDIKPISMFDIKDFNKDVWENPETQKFREKLLKNNRNCPCFDIFI